MALHPQDQELLDSFPVFSEEDIRRVNDLFTHYILYSTTKEGGRRCICSRCRKSFVMPGYPRTETPEWREFMSANHNKHAKCPECGRIGQMKNTAICRSGRSLGEWRRVILLHEKEGAVSGQAYYIRKEYSPWCWNPEVEFLDKALYLFRPGEAIAWRFKHDWTGLGVTPSGTQLDEGYERMREVSEPWSATSYGGWSGYTWNGYHVIGMERLKGTFLEYAAEAYLKWDSRKRCDSEEHDMAMRFLGAATMRPEVEMLAKAGMRAMVRELVICKKKLSREVNWGEKDPRKAFGLNAGELKEFAAIDGSAKELRWYRALKKAGISCSFLQLEEVRKSLNGAVQDRFFRACATGCGVKPSKALGYLCAFSKNAWDSSDHAIMWADYVEAAKYCGFDLSDPLVLMPKRLQEAHDGAVETELRLRHEKETTEDSYYQRRYRSLMERYGFEDSEFCIRPPSSSREIISEGKYLRHCVGRYAGSHAAGRTNILFMRRKSHPFTPAWTIEIRGTSMIQVQGKNDAYESKPKGNAKKFLEMWLAWVAAGSKRDKHGKPIVTIKEDKTA